VSGRRECPPEEILEGLPEEVRALAERLRGLVREGLPGATEHGYPGWRGIGYRDERAGYLCGIFPRRDSVRLLFEHGAALPDPEGLFTGGGSQTRYAEIRPGDPVPGGKIRRMLEAAVLHGVLR